MYPRSERKTSIVDDRSHEVQQTLDSDLTAVNTDASANTAANLKDSLKIDLVVVPYFVYNASEKRLLEREKEYVTCLQRNLNHDLVSRVHVLTSNAEGTWQIFQKYELSNQTKLLVSELKSIVMVRPFFEYISHNLVDKNVMFISGDIWLGSGFDQVDPIVMRKQKIMYAITRQVTHNEERCGQKDLCLEENYIGCHDTFLFYLHEPMPEGALQPLDFKFPAPGIENVLMWVFQKKLGYCLLNPCSILQTFHFHCAAVHNHGSWKRVNNGDKSALAPPTKKLVCK